MARGVGAEVNSAHADTISNRGEALTNSLSSVAPGKPSPRFCGASPAPTGEGSILFEVDQMENDRLLLAEEQRRQDLLELAVRSFAPHLHSTPGVKAIYLYSTNASLRKTIRDAFEGSRTVVVEHTITNGRDRKGINQVAYEGMYITLPDKADLVVTKANLNSKTEWLAAQLKALPLVLPEGLGYLYKRLERVPALVLVGAEQGKKC